MRSARDAGGACVYADLMSPFTVVIPWRPAPTREGAYAFVTDWYARNVPEATVRAIDTDDDVFVLAACRNEAVRAVAPTRSL